MNKNIGKKNSYVSNLINYLKNRLIKLKQEMADH